MLAVVGVPAIVVAAVFVARVVLHPDPYPDEWDPRVAQLVEFVEDERGLTFKHPVQVDFLTDAQYTDQARQDASELTDEDRQDLDDSTAMLRALGLVSGDVDLFDASNELADTGTLAFYDPVAERVVVRGTETTVNLEVTLVHELTHVLQDQYFDLERDLVDDAEDDSDDAARSEAFVALVEGDALRIELTYTNQLPADERDEYLATYGEELAAAEDNLADVPAALQAFQIAPYILGQPLVELLAAEGGNAAVDDAFADPPSTAEHMLAPLSYLADDGPTSLDTPDLPEGVEDERDDGELGAVDLFLVLAERIDPLVALDAADGWGNARFVSYEANERTCVRIAVDGDTATDDQELRAALDAWVAATPPEAGASVADLGDGRSLVESCDPGTEVDMSNDRAVDVLNLPATRAQLALVATNEGLDLDTGWEAGNCFVRQLTLEQLVEANTSTEISPELDQAITDAFATCR